MTKEEHIAIYCGNCGNCIVCNDDINAASNRSFDVNLVRDFCEIRPGVFVLYDASGRVQLVTEKWDEILIGYRNRTPYVRKVVATRKFVGLDLDKLEINL